MIMSNHKTRLCYTVILVIGLYAGSLSANPASLDDALKQYYAGYPDQAIELLEPIAASGDIDAQYLLGNMLYTLSQGDPLQWYHAAAEQGSAAANFALGTIYQNRWVQSRLAEDADLAQAHFQRALELGDQNAQAALTKLAEHRRATANSSSLTYTNESFSSTREAPEKRKTSSQTATASTAKTSRKRASARDELSEALANFQSSGDLLSDAQRLQKLISQYQGGTLVGSSEQVDSSSISALTQLLGGFESTEKLISDLSKLYEHIKTATELSTAPGAN